MRYLILIVVGSAIVALAGAPRAFAGLPTSPYFVSETVAPSELQCDGDSARLMAHVTNPDGTPASHVPVAIAVWAGTVTVKGVTSEHVAITETNNLGFVQAWLTPTPGTKTQFRYLVFRDDVIDLDRVEGNPFAGSPVACPMAAGTAVTGHVWYDRDADGTQDRGEPNIAHGAVTLIGDDGGSRGSWADHTTYTDSGGHFGWPGVSGPVRSLCVDASRFHIVTFNGETFAGSPDAATLACSYFSPYGAFPPSGHFEIGVQQR